MQLATHSKPHHRDVRDCRVGDWQHVAFVYEWRWQTGNQLFQPLAKHDRRRCPFDVSSFVAGRPVWKFRRERWPGMEGSGGFWDVWQRVE